ncbi:MAG: hypothetical protein K2N81_04275 [Acetatifactor sp.]|nr:hypothetical protein [Acetatifactor sp.]
MNRAEFMRQLESLLQNIPQAEREEALQYYNDYFDDAGPENEKAVLEALGNPFRVAENIKRDVNENGYQDEDIRGNSVRHPVVKYQDAENGNGQDGGQNGNGSGTSASKPKSEDMPTWQLVLFIVLGILLFPVALSLASALASAIFGLFVGWFALIFGFGVAAFVLFVVLVALLVAGITCILEMPIAGMALIGGGLFCGGLGILFLMLTVAMAGIATPALFKGCAQLYNYLTRKIKREATA